MLVHARRAVAILSLGLPRRTHENAFHDNGSFPAGNGKRMAVRQMQGQFLKDAGRLGGAASLN
jgi:hypothetical protein